jgi:dipeptidyl aminopeptidase/acylaminoacyl peptidase
MIRRAWAVGLLFVIASACSALPPCYPPAYFAPPPGAPYLAEDIRIAAEAGHVLAGTLTLPTDVEPPLPAVVLISGSHAQNRDHVGTNRRPINHYRPFRQIADALSRRGIAALRMDDRGVGCSGGGPLDQVPGPERADDTRAGLGFLRSRPDVDSRRLGLLGLSEGANIAILLAARDPAIKAIVTLAATATPGWDVYVSQQRHLVQNDIFTDQERERLAAGADDETVLAERTRQFRREVAKGKWGPWWRDFLAFDPSVPARDVTCPALILHGDRDTNVPVEHANLIADAMRSGGNEDVTVEILAGHNHLLLEDPDAFFRRYGELLSHTNQISADILTLIADWLAQHLRSDDGSR